MMNQQDNQELINPHLMPHQQPPPLQSNSEGRANSDSHSSRSRSRSQSKSIHRVEQKEVRQESVQLQKIEEPQKNGNQSCIQNEVKQKTKMKRMASKINSNKEMKKRRVAKQYITDFSEFLPEALIHVTRTNITSKIRIGERYQVQVPSAPPLLSQKRSMEQWRVWGGSSAPQDRPTQQHLRRFKQILGANRNEQQLISMRERLGMRSWGRVLQWAQGRRTELRWTFHQTQRNRPS